MGIPQQPVPQPDKVVLLRLESKKPLETLANYALSDVICLTKLELIAQLLDIPQTELLEILYA